MINGKPPPLRQYEKTKMIGSWQRKVKRIFSPPLTPADGILLLRILAILLICFSFYGFFCHFLSPPLLSSDKKTPGGHNNPWLDDLLEKIRFVESGGSTSLAINGDNGRAGGPLQIHPCVVDDVNFYCDTNYTYADRYDLEKAKEIARLYINWWLKINREEIAARIWNGGPRGWEKESTEKYWEKVRNGLQAAGR